MYKLEFEIVSPIGPGGQFYLGEKPVCKPETVPDKFWHGVSHQTNDPWDQYKQLKDWVKTGAQLVRSVHLFETSEPDWKEIKDA